MIVDTNVLLRSLAGPTGPQRDAARARIQDARDRRAPMSVLSATVVELAYVLGSAGSGYRWGRADIADALESLLDEPAFEIEHATALRAALEPYRGRSIALIDCLLDAIAAQRGTKVLSFDDDLRKLGHRELP